MSISKNELNKQINKLYRQLGKEVFEKSQYDNNFQIRDVKHIINKIDNKIKKIKVISDKDDVRILEPESGDDGIILYRFCKKCKAGNNPESTHCIRCKEKLI